MNKLKKIISTIFISILFYILFKNCYDKNEKKKRKIILESNTYNENQETNEKNIEKIKTIKI
jgi:hypothetical protein